MQGEKPNLGTLQNPTESADIVFAGNLIILPNKENFLRLDFSNDVGKAFLVFAGSSS